MSRIRVAALLGMTLLPLAFQTALGEAEAQMTTQTSGIVTHYKTATVDGVSIFYRKAGPADGPVVLLLHGFPTSSHMFRNLIPALADRYHVIAPDHTKFAYTFGHYSDIMDGLIEKLSITSYAMYVMDYGAPVG
jgi:pimeloyl-ACP methyl ester carboxylesterase